MYFSSGGPWKSCELARCTIPAPTPLSPLRRGPQRASSLRKKGIDQTHLWYLFDIMQSTFLGEPDGVDRHTAFLLPSTPARSLPSAEKEPTYL